MLADTGAGLTFVVAPKRTRHRQSKDLEKGVGIERYGAHKAASGPGQLNISDGVTA